jgi:carbamoyltransferase
MKVLGISAGFHDAAVSLIDGNQILFAAHSERYSKNKHDKHLCSEIIEEAFSFGEPDVIAYYEKPWIKKIRQLYAGQYSDALNMNDITVNRYLKEHVPNLKLKKETKFRHYSHHLSHAAASFQTSPFTKATVVVIDAIGEWDTISIFGAEYNAKGVAKYKLLWKQTYPNSIGLFYSAMTKRVGLKPLDEEYILMGMAAYGKPKYKQEMLNDFVLDLKDASFKQNLHIGIPNDYLGADYNGLKNFDIAASAQDVVEKLIVNVIRKAASFGWTDNLVLSGGVALNCTANRLLGEYFDRIWIMPNPGDAGSSLGAAALVTGKMLDWKGPYLGTNIPGQYPTHALVEHLLKFKIAGVASGRAEFGPRALGNRSLLADPRGDFIKDKVNEIKRRQQFRPFAPVILEEHAYSHFKMPEGFSTSPYMQVVSECRHPEQFPAIIHVDGTSRVQTVSKSCKSGIRWLLEEWFKQTGCPILLNTSLNIRGESMVNTVDDAKRFEKEYNVKVFS